MACLTPSEQTKMRFKRKSLFRNLMQYFMLPPPVVKVRKYDPLFQKAASKQHLRHLSRLLFCCINYFFLEQDTGLEEF